PELHGKTFKVVSADVGAHTSTVESIFRLGTLPPIRHVILYEMRGGTVLERGRTTGLPGVNYHWEPHLEAPIILKANLTKGMHWTHQAKDALREYDVLDFVTVRVAAGTFTNVAKIRVQYSSTNPTTTEEQSVITEIEYYAPKVGLVRHDVLDEKDG